jgi:hypothetical protein
MTRIRRVVACISAIALFVLWSSSVAPVGATDPASAASADAAVAWLKTQQQSDGGFEVTGFAGFETRDVVLAVAEQAQTGSTWSTSEALAAIQALQASGTGDTPLDYLEGLVGGSSDHGVAAKTVVLVSAPLGIDPTAFGSVDLLTKMGGCASTTASTFNGLLYLVIAQQLLCAGSPAANVTAIRDAQQANGGWGFAGDPNGTDIDNDTTALAVEALIGDGATVTDPVVHAALAFLAANFQSNGAWQFFGDDDPNSTAMAILAITAAGFDVTTSCWRDTIAPETAGTPYTSPDAWLRSQQLTSGTDAGRVQSPSDAFPPINTLATSQTVEALLRSWLPVTRGTAPTCASTPPATTTPPGGQPATVEVQSEVVTVAATGPVVTVQPRFTG